MAYVFEGQYCGDFELNPATINEARENRNFTDVIKKWPHHTFIPEVMHLECNQLYPDGGDITLPDCDYQPFPLMVLGATFYKDCPECDIPCKRKYLRMNGECEVDTNIPVYDVSKYNYNYDGLFSSIVDDLILLF